MPIRINLLAEAQAAEVMRRRDPVKRSMWIGGLLVALVLVWACSVQLQALLMKNQLAGVEARLAARDKDYKGVLENQKKANDVRQKLTSLTQLAANRLLNGNLLNALQQTVIDDVQLTRLKVEQAYTPVAATPNTTNDNRVVFGRPGTVTERILLTLEAKATGATPDDQIGKFKAAIAGQPYFLNALGKTNEIKVPVWGQKKADADGIFVPFTLEIRFPDRTR